MGITYRRGEGQTISSSFKPNAGETREPDATGIPHQLVDSDHGVARSVTGWLTCMAGAAVMWAVRAQPLPAISSTEAELYGLSTSVADLLGFLNVLEELEVGYHGTISVLVDSRAARLLAEDCASSARTRHIHRRWYYVEHFINEGIIRLEAVRGTHNAANFLTKAVGGSAFGNDRTYALGRSA
jgi:hypothetical protein